MFVMERRSMGDMPPNSATSAEFHTLPIEKFTGITTPRFSAATTKHTNRHNRLDLS